MVFTGNEGGKTHFLERRFQSFIFEILRVASLSGEKLIFSTPLEKSSFFFNSLGTNEISIILKISMYVHVVLLVNFPKQFELCFYFKCSRSSEVL